MKIHMIVAMSSNKTIGKDGGIPWKLSPDMKRFKELTTGQVVVMGRKTFESLGRPRGLPNRDNFVLTRNVEDFKLAYPEVSCTDNLGLLLRALKSCKSPTKVYIIGGEEIYRQAEPYADEINLTLIYRPIEGDVKFPFDPARSPDWKLVRSSTDFKPLLFDESSGLGYAFFDYKKKRWWQKLLKL